MIVYTICCTTRSGSTFLARLLESAGLGRPAEYLNPDPTTGRPYWGPRIGVSEDASFREYLTELQVQRSQNGIFGVKTVTRALHKQMLENCDVRSVLIRRQDTLRQAISMYRAKYSGTYHTPNDKHRSVPFNREAILSCREKINAANDRWLKYLTELDRPPHFVWYEDLVRMPLAFICEIRDFLGAEIPIDNVSSDTVIMRED